MAKYETLSQRQPDYIDENRPLAEALASVLYKSQGKLNDASLTTQVQQDYPNLNTTNKDIRKMLWTFFRSPEEFIKVKIDGNTPGIGTLDDNNTDPIAVTQINQDSLYGWFNLKSSMT